MSKYAHRPERHKSLALIVGGCALLALSAAEARAEDTRRPTGDTQTWYEGQFALPLRPRLDMIGSGGVRLGRESAHLVYERAGASASFRLARFASVAPSYNYIASQAVAGKDTREHRFALDGTLNWRLLGFDVSDRNRFERRILAAGDYSRYRNRFQIQHPLKLWRRRISLALSDEVYYDGALALWSRNRFSVAIDKKVGKGISLELFYVRQNDHYSKPGDINAVGINFRSQGHKLN